MNPAVLIASIYVFALAAFLGYQVISRVPPLLHTPLMSATNAISGISLIGSLVLAGRSALPHLRTHSWIRRCHHRHHQRGGRIRHHRPHAQDVQQAQGNEAGGSRGGQMTLSTYFMEATYLIASILFVLALKGMSHPETARRGMFLAEGGMFAAIIGTLIGAHIVTWVWIIAGLSIGSIIGAWMAIWVPMTAMPQRTALSHAFGALAAALVGVGEFLVHARRYASCHPRRTGL